MHKDIKEKCDAMIEDLRGYRDSLDRKKSQINRDLFYKINSAIKELRRISGTINTFYSDDE